MARPNPNTLLQGMKGLSPIEITVLDSTGYWIVTYKGKPINVVTQNLHQYKPAKKYLRTGGPNRGSIENIAENLNKYFDTTDFKCVEVTFKEKQDGKKL